MSSDKGKINYEANLELPECIAYLESIASGLRSGRLTFSKGPQRLDLAPPESVRAGIRARRKRGTASFRFELSWDPDAVRATPKVTKEEVAQPDSSAASEPPANEPSSMNHVDVRGLLDTLTRDELYEKAQRLELEGRSQMGRDELVHALATGYAAVHLFTREELYQRAREADVAGRSRMSKQQLLDSLEDLPKAEA